MTRLTSAQYQELAKEKLSKKPASFALGRLKAGEMNKTEARYENDVLKPLMSAGDILMYKFEAVKLRLADNTFYTPDWFVMCSDLTIELHEVKGFWTDDARVKIKVAAAMYPFRFLAAQHVKGAWKIERF